MKIPLYFQEGFFLRIVINATQTALKILILHTSLLTRLNI